MIVSNEQLKKIVVDGRLLSLEAWASAVQNAERRGRDVVDVLIERGDVPAQELYGRIAEYLNVPYVDLRREQIDFDVLKILLEKTLVELGAVPFRKPDDESLDVAFLRPQDTPAIDEIQKVTGLKVRPHLTNKKSFSYALRLYERDLAVELDRLIDEASPRARGKRKAPPEYPVVKILDTILTHAVMSNVSDIHVEPLADALLIRFRVDGLLRDVLELPTPVAAPLLGRIKVLTGLKLDEHRLPQDGRMAFFAESENVFVRVSVIPTFYGEKAVLRILNEQEQRLTLADLGLEGHNHEVVEAAMRKPRGLLLVVGPTGSGKTTTLYALLNILNTEKVNISTIEDPIEYGLPRINQTQVNPQVGYTFANGLRALLRQDPNVMMVGEIRDEDTADIAVQAGLTGHLVLSTLHTMDSLGVLPRLEEMGVRPFVLTSTLSAVIAQRLVRRICKDCVETYRLTPAQAAGLDRWFHTDGVLESLRRMGAVPNAVRHFKDLTLYRGRGCNQCRHSGYAGRVGVYEVLEMTHDLRRAITEHAVLDQIFAVARKDGMVTLLEDGWSKAVRGLTTVEEILRVVKE